MSHPSDNGAAPGGESKPASPLQAALAEAIGAFSKDPGGAARRLLDTAERALPGAGGGASGGRDALTGLAAAASRFLSEAQARASGRDGEASSKPPPGGGPAGTVADSPRGGDEQAAPGSAPATPPSTTFVGLGQLGEGSSFHVRADAVDAVTPAGEAGCVLHLSDGSTVEAGQGSDATARLLSGLARLSQAGTQQGLYVRSGAVLAVAAPADGGCVLRLRGGRELAAADAAAVAAGLLAERDG